MKKKHTILLVNDDGIFSPGLRFLIKICKKVGKVLVVAPDKNQSGMSHAITVDKEIKRPTKTILTRQKCKPIATNYLKSDENPET